MNEFTTKSNIAIMRFILELRVIKFEGVHNNIVFKTMKMYYLVALYKRK